MELQKKRLEVLDSLRGIAALIVVFHHLIKLNADVIKPAVGETIWSVINFISNTNSGAVLFFFILSGFCIGLAQKNKSFTNKNDINIYFYRRFKRILPIYWLALLLSYLVGVITNETGSPTFSIENLVGNLLFLQTPENTPNYWFSPFGNNGPLWSLSYEMFFYLLFPVFILLINKINLQSHQKIITSILLITSLAAIVINKYIFFIPIFSFLSLFIIWYYGYILSGCYLNNKREDALFIITFLVASAGLVLKNYIPSNSISEIFQGLLMSCILYLPIRFKEAVSKNPVYIIFQKITNSLFASIGIGSYALYALHYPIMLLMVYFQVNLFVQLAFIAVLIYVVQFIEKWSIRQHFSFLKRNYIPVLTITNSKKL